MGITEETALKLVKSLDSIGYELKRQNDMKEDLILERVADQVAYHEPNLAMIIDMMRNKYEN
ncbi:hypothetical protein SAMN04487975_107133 [Planococcus glaciei]|uniref:hypothetical protein n=1 Tax=Planococcus glaciei TaxID=459472 RepID=UPI000887AA5A|nr:hypothetical protein [Planococcus glaciei]SDH74044.1 hypothetical protein SAMN04487975_107133 [Planococcus glaciei]